MQLTKLRASPVLQAEVPPCAPAGKMDGGTASQLIASVVRTVGRAQMVGERRRTNARGMGKMTVRRSIVAAIVVACLVGPVVAADKAEDAAQAAAESWLKLNDAGDYAGSWDQAANSLKGAVEQADWVQTSGRVRTPLGKLVSRKLKSREYREKMPGAPHGKYVVIQYDTVFEHKASAVETITPRADPDGAWRVWSYFIH